jgi:Antitoxin Xre/MbcA/ParS C-terminal toxin-binding domain/Antitoxin Xre-like helix-turn-helix domain
VPVRKIAAKEEGIPPLRRARPDVRKRMSGPALKTYFNIVDRIWGLDSKTQAALLGWPGQSTFYNYKNGEHGAVSFDILTRISLLLGIFKALRILYPERSLADKWIKLPNSNPLFGGTTPAEFLATGEIDTLYKVRRFLDARRGGWN